MNPEHLLTEIATVTSRTPTGSRDTFGNVLVTTVDRTTICYHEQDSRSEIHAGGDLADETWTVYFPEGDPITRTDAVTIAGQTFEVVGNPYPTWNPRTSQTGHVVATLRRTDG